MRPHLKTNNTSNMMQTEWVGFMHLRTHNIHTRTHTPLTTTNTKEKKTKVTTTLKKKKKKP